MAVPTMSYPAAWQQPGVITVYVGREHLKTCPVSEFSDVCEMLVARYDALPEAETPLIVIWWHPEDLRRVFQQNGLRPPTVH